MKRFRLQYDTGDLLLLAGRPAARRQSDRAVGSALPDAARDCSQLAGDRRDRPCPNCSRSRTTRGRRTPTSSASAFASASAQWQASATVQLHPRQERLHAPVRDAACRQWRLLRLRRSRGQRLRQRADRLRRTRYALQGDLPARSTSPTPRRRDGASGSPTRWPSRSRTATTCSTSIRRRPTNIGFRPKPGNERHRLVAQRHCSTCRAGFKISRLSQFGSGARSRCSTPATAAGSTSARSHPLPGQELHQGHLRLLPGQRTVENDFQRLRRCDDSTSRSICSTSSTTRTTAGRTVIWQSRLCDHDRLPAAMARSSAEAVEPATCRAASSSAPPSASSLPLPRAAAWRRGYCFTGGCRSV